LEKIHDKGEPHGGTGLHLVSNEKSKKKALAHYIRNCYIMDMNSVAELIQLQYGSSKARQFKKPLLMMGIYFKTWRHSFTLVY
jgi:hypothetical protein